MSRPRVRETTPISGACVARLALPVAPAIELRGDEERVLRRIGGGSAAADASEFLLQRHA